MAADATQYLLPEGIGVEAALSRLADRFELEAGPPVAVERTFFDTFDGRLHQAGIALIAQGGRLVAAAGPGYRELAAGPAAGGGPLSADALPDGPLRGLIGPLVEVRALRPIARTRGRSRMLRILNGDAKTVVRLRLETASAVAGKRKADVPLAPRVYVAGVRGYDRALERVRAGLAEEFGLEASAVPLHHAAVVACGGAPGGSPTTLDLHLAPAQPAQAGAAAALAELLRTIELNLPGVLGDVDSEFLHDLRVAVRRTRSIQRQLAAAFPPERLAVFRSEFRWLGQVTGPTRDLDVLLLDLARAAADLAPGRAAELVPIGELLRRRRELEWRRMAAALGSPRARCLLADWAGFLAGLGVQAPDGLTVAGRPLGQLAGRRIRTVYRQMRRAGLAIDEQTPAVALHDLRRQGKELRYLLEIFADLYPAEAVRPTVKTLKALQETLGRFQDREVQASTLRGLGGELAAAEGGPAALIALGVVLERVEADRTAARAAFAERFTVFAAPAQRAVIRQAFR